MFCQIECMQRRIMLALPAGPTASGLAVAERKDTVMMRVKILLNMFLVVGRLT